MLIASHRHNDGDFFVHFLDSPEQALLVIPLWSDIVPRGGGTVVCADGIKCIAKHLVGSYIGGFFTRTRSEIGRQLTRNSTITPRA